MNHSVKWKTILGLMMVITALLLEWSWVWGVLFLFWTIPSLQTGVVYFVEPVEKKHNPILFWFMIVLWLSLSVFMILDSSVI